MRIGKRSAIGAANGTVHREWHLVGNWLNIEFIILAAVAGYFKFHRFGELGFLGQTSMIKFGRAVNSKLSQPKLFGGARRAWHLG